MIKEVYAQLNSEYLNKLFETYIKINDEKEIINIVGRLIQSEDEIINKSKIIEIFDKFYEIFKKYREQYRQIQQMELNLEKRNQLKQQAYLQIYKQKYCSDISSLLNKLTGDIKRAIKVNHNRNKEIEAFLQLNYADYKRYQCELTLNEESLKELLEETEQAYQVFFQLCDEIKVCHVSTSYLIGKYNYSMFLFEVKKTRKEAIDYLQQVRIESIDKLDTIFKNFTESYKMMDLINETLTSWSILTDNKFN
jgi:hypothetical protein